MLSSSVFIYISHYLFIKPRLKTMHKMMERSGTLFRDPEDVEQATRFLHENGRFISTLFIFFKFILKIKKGCQFIYKYVFESSFIVEWSVYVCSFSNSFTNYQNYNCTCQYMSIAVFFHSWSTSIIFRADVWHTDIWSLTSFFITLTLLALILKFTFLRLG